MGARDGLNTEGAMEGSGDAEWVRVANELLRRCHVNLRVRRLAECDANVFVAIYEATLGEKVPDSIAVPKSKEDDAHNVQSIIDSLALDYLQISLSHITGENVVNGHKDSIRNLLEIFDGLVDYLSEQVDEDSSQHSGDDDVLLSKEDLVVVHDALGEDLGPDRERGASRVEIGGAAIPDRAHPSANLSLPSWDVDGTESTAELIRLGETAHSFTVRTENQAAMDQVSVSSVDLVPDREKRDLNLTQTIHGPEHRVPASGLFQAGRSDSLSSLSEHTISTHLALPPSIKAVWMEEPMPGTAAGLLGTMQVAARPREPLEEDAAASPTHDRAGSSPRHVGVHPRYSWVADPLAGSAVPLRPPLQLEDPGFSRRVGDGTSTSPRDGLDSSAERKDAESQTDLQEEARATSPKSCVCEDRARTGDDSTSRDRQQNASRDESLRTDDVSGTRRSLAFGTRLGEAIAATDNRRPPTSALPTMTKALYDAGELRDAKGGKGSPCPSRRRLFDGDALPVSETLSRRRAKNLESERELREMSDCLSHRLEQLDRALRMATGATCGRAGDPALPRGDEEEEVFSRHSDSAVDYSPARPVTAPRGGRSTVATATPRARPHSTSPPRKLSPRRLSPQGPPPLLEEVLQLARPAPMRRVRWELRQEGELQRLKAQVVKRAYEEELKDARVREGLRLETDRRKLTEMEDEYKENVRARVPLTPQARRVYAPRRAPGSAPTTPSRKHRRQPPGSGYGSRSATGYGSGSGSGTGTPVKTARPPHRGGAGGAASPAASSPWRQGKSRLRSVSLSPAQGGLLRPRRPSPLRVKENDLLPVLLAEFPHLHISPHTLNRMWHQQCQQMDRLTRIAARPDRSHAKLQSELEEAQRKHDLLVAIIKKEQEHNQRLREVRERVRQQKASESRRREQREQVARARHYYSRYHLQQRARMLRERTREERVFRQLFEEGLEIQKERLSELRSYARDKHDEQRQRQRDELQSVENYYKDQFAMLADTVSQERRDMQVREKAQGKAVHKLRRELRGKMERDIQELQELLARDDAVAHFREVEADRVRRQLQVATFTYAQEHAASSP
ncbi:centrosomal protein of 95 kDa isoform X2 [Petromyzon marinus]|uniref:Centrosomal protein of 95 kDa isoform X2 n=1 Tax=Petromyzon marinus TaxID=7757 RepID=A0AAJ7TU76_PETMA|nr:centrosomal protein of 95 kDa isoform X2 [Petromyzon marinus]